MLIFKQCFIDHIKSFSDFRTEYESLNNKISLKLRVMNESLATTNETIKNQQETILKKVKERCDFVINDFGLFKKNMNEENTNKQKSINENLFEMKEKIQNCEKNVSGIVCIEEIQSIVNDKAFNMNQIICNQVKEQLIRPAVEKLMIEIKNGSE